MAPPAAILASLRSTRCSTACLGTQLPDPLLQKADEVAQACIVDGLNDLHGVLAPIELDGYRVPLEVSRAWGCLPDLLRLLEEPRRRDQISKRAASIGSSWSASITTGLASPGK